MATEQLFAEIKEQLMDALNAPDVAGLPRTSRDRFKGYVLSACTGVELAGRLVDANARRTAEARDNEPMDWRMRQTPVGDR